MNRKIRSLKRSWFWFHTFAFCILIIDKNSGEIFSTKNASVAKKMKLYREILRSILSLR
ncbi:hypothetical protein LEP1GSC052_2747 [Leptospira kmetyi serovar Malaysia str. Bejo-Iso9]|nr:hypothetical protein LEP1GSC052_2747 [Leptospira kmetyi serovar Malaysia str. Bejo-Iso9]